MPIVCFNNNNNKLKINYDTSDKYYKGILIHPFPCLYTHVPINFDLFQQCFTPILT